MKKNLLLIIVLWCLVPAYSSATTFYYNDGGRNHEWTDLVSWFMDETFQTLPASVLPGVSDDVIIPSAEGVWVDTNSGPVPTIRSLTMNGGSFVGLPMIVTNGMIVNSGSYILLSPGDEITGDVTFNDGSTGNGSIVGNVIFNGISVFSSGTIHGDVTFNDSSRLQNNVIVEGLATLNDSSYNDGTLNGNAVFRDTSSNNGTVEGNACFEAGATNSGTVSGISSACDGVVPVLSLGSPATALPSGTTTTVLSVTTDETAICKYGTVAGTEYDSIESTFSTTAGTTHTQSLTGLTDGTSYTYYVRCTDASSNINTLDYTVSFSVASPTIVENNNRSGSAPRSRVVPTSVVVSPPQTIVSPQTIEQIKTILNTLIAELNQRIANGETADNAPSTTTPLFTRDLKLGLVGEDVKALQIYLNTHGFPLTTTGAGSPQNETTTFGPLLKSALIKFQIANKITPAEGYFGERTRKFVVQ